MAVSQSLQEKATFELRPEERHTSHSHLKAGQRFSRIRFGFVKKNVPGRVDKYTGSQLGKTVGGSRDREEARKKGFVKMRRSA